MLAADFCEPRDPRKARFLTRWGWNSAAYAAGPGRQLKYNFTDAVAAGLSGRSVRGAGPSWLGRDGGSLSGIRHTVETGCGPETSLCRQRNRPKNEASAASVSQGCLSPESPQHRDRPSLAAQSNPRRLTFDNRRAYSPAWLPDGREILFSSNRAGVFGLWRIAVQGGKSPQRIEGVGEDGFYPAVSRQGHRLTYT